PGFRGPPGCFLPLYPVLSGDEREAGEGLTQGMACATIMPRDISRHIIKRGKDHGRAAAYDRGGLLYIIVPAAPGPRLRHDAANPGVVRRTAGHGPRYSLRHSQPHEPGGLITLAEEDGRRKTYA